MTTVACVVSGADAVLTLRGAAQRNAMDEEFWTSFADVLDQVEAAPHVRAILLTAEGPVFCGGGDIARMGRSLDDMEAGTFEGPERVRMDRNAALLLRWAGLPAVRVAAVGGPAIGAGLALALSCDIRLMADTAYLDTGFSRMGLPGDGGVSYYLRRVVGPARAAAWLLRARRVAADEAAATGLVDEVVPADELLRRAAQRAADLAQSSAEAAAWILDRATEVAQLGPALDRERDATVAAKQGPFHKAAVTAFLERGAHR